VEPEPVPEPELEEPLPVAPLPESLPFFILPFLPDLWVVPLSVLPFDPVVESACEPEPEDPDPVDPDPDPVLPVLPVPVDWANVRGSMAALIRSASAVFFIVFLLGLICSVNIVLRIPLKAHEINRTSSANSATKLLILRLKFINNDPQLQRFLLAPIHNHHWPAHRTRA